MRGKIIAIDDSKNKITLETIIGRTEYTLQLPTQGDYNFASAVTNTSDSLDILEKRVYCKATNAFGTVWSGVAETVIIVNNNEGIRYIIDGLLASKSGLSHDIGMKVIEIPKSDLESIKKFN